MVVSFFGHRDTPSTVKPLLKQTVQQLIDKNEDITFLVHTGRLIRWRRAFSKKRLSVI